MAYDRYRQGGYGADRYGADRNRQYERGYGEREHNDRGDYGAQERWGGYGQSDRGDYGRERGWADHGRSEGRDGYRSRDYGRQPQGYDQRERGFIDRSVDEVRSWFGDDEAERRRERDAREDAARDDDYRSWRSGQIAAFDRDYDEYRQENRSRFNDEFATWRTDRQGQRTSLGQVTEHMEVVGSDGSHVGTVDKVRGDRIILTRTDPDAGGRHHSIPSRWIDRVDERVTLRKTADEAQGAWRDEEREQGVFSDRDRDDDRNTGDRGRGYLGRSFSGTY